MKDNTKTQFTLKLWKVPVLKLFKNLLYYKNKMYLAKHFDFWLMWFKLNIYKQGFFNTDKRNKIQESIFSGKCI